MVIINSMRRSCCICSGRSVDHVARSSAQAEAAKMEAAAETGAAVIHSHHSRTLETSMTSHRRRLWCSSVSPWNPRLTTLTLLRTLTAILLLSHYVIGTHASFFLSLEQNNKHPWCARSKVAADEVHVQSSFKVNATLPVFTSLFSRDVLSSTPFASPSCSSSTWCGWWLDRYSQIPALVLLNASDFNVHKHEHTRALSMLLHQSHVIALATSSMSFSDAPPSPSPLPGSSRRKSHHKMDEDEDKEDGAVHVVKRDLSLFETITGVILPFYTVSDVDVDVDINNLINISTTNTTTRPAFSSTSVDSFHDGTSAISATAMTRLHSLGLALPLFRLQLSLRHNKSFDVLFDDDALRYVRSAMEHHHGDHDHRQRGPRKLLSVLDFLTHAQLICLLWRLQCHTVSPCDAVFRLCVTVVRRVPFDMLDTNELRYFVPLSKYKYEYEYEYEYENDTQVHRDGVVDDIGISSNGTSNSSSRGKEDGQEERSCFDGQRETVARAVSLARQGDVSEQDIRALLFHPYYNTNGDVQPYDSKRAMTGAGGWPDKGRNWTSMLVVWAPVGFRVLSVVLLCCALADMARKKDRTWVRRLLGTRLSDRLAGTFEHRAKLF